ncbi:MAG: hypothetical protein IPG84_16385 [Betaproteobacteria bacterium]|nr:hypothetical protein [Betaproteobacteria bacterium]
MIGAVDSVLVNPIPSIATTQYLGIPQFGTSTQIGYRVYGDGAIGVPPDENSDGTPARSWTASTSTCAVNPRCWARRARSG